MQFRGERRTLVQTDKQLGGDATILAPMPPSLLLLSPLKNDCSWSSSELACTLSARLPRRAAGGLLQRAEAAAERRLLQVAARADLRGRWFSRSQVGGGGRREREAGDASMTTVNR